MGVIDVSNVTTKVRKLAGRGLRRVQGASPKNPSYRQEPVLPEVRPLGTSVIYLHHSTGHNVWNGGVPELVSTYNERHGTDYTITERAYTHWPHPWTNDPVDYWRCWVDHRDDKRFLGQETLDELASAYDVVVWKHCFTAARIAPDSGIAKASSRVKMLANFKLQYAALRDVMLEHSDTTFLVWTVPPLAPGATDPEQAARATEFARWVREEWDRPGDNIHLFDYYALAAPGGQLRSDYAVSNTDSHPSAEFSKEAAAAFVARLTDVLEGRAD